MRSQISVAGTIPALVLLLATAAQSVTRAEPVRTFPMAADGRLSLDNINGSINIEAWDKAEIEIQAVATADDADDLDNITSKVDADQNWVKIETEFKKTGHHAKGLGMNYTIHAPSSMAIDEVSSVNGGIRIQGMAGRVHASAVNGRIEAASLSNDVELETVNGKIEADFARVDKGQKISLQSVNGAIELSLPADLNADLDLQTLTGGIESDLGLEVEKGMILGQTAEGRVGSGGATIEAETVNGPISVRKR